MVSGLLVSLIVVLYSIACGYLGAEWLESAWRSTGWCRREDLMDFAVPGLRRTPMI